MASGHTWEELFPCSQWMKSFAHVTIEKGPATLRSFEQVPREDAHNIQTHAVDLASLVSRVSIVSWVCRDCFGIVQGNIHVHCICALQISLDIIFHKCKPYIVAQGFSDVLINTSKLIKLCLLWLTL